MKREHRTKIEQELVDKLIKDIDKVLEKVMLGRSDKVIEREKIFSAQIKKLEHLLPKMYWHVDKYGEVHIDAEGMEAELAEAIKKANELIKELGYDR
jgi:Uri superfamily endonuclease